jgi:hypothetical protein
MKSPYAIHQKLLASISFFLVYAKAGAICLKHSAFEIELGTEQAKRERCWIAERDGEIAGSVFLVAESKSAANMIF